MSQLKIRTNKACRLLGMFLLARIQQQQDAKEMSQLASEINYNYDNILIQETSKPIIQNFKKRKKSLCINTPIIRDKNERNINHIIISLANFKGFVKYIKYQNLSKEDLRKTAEVLKHEFYKKGSDIPFGKWDGEYFHTGNIMIETNQRAQFGDFAFVPRSNGSLSFLKVRSGKLNAPVISLVNET